MDFKKKYVTAFLFAVGQGGIIRIQDDVVL